MQPALALTEVSKRYGGFQAVDRLSFEVRPGAICGFLGPNGAGKTSTLRMILGLTPADTGSIRVLGADDGRAISHRIGFLPEERGLYRKMNPVDAIAFFGALKGLTLAEGRRRAVRLLDEIGLGEASRRPIKALSKGMAQKVQLLAAIVHEPDFVILDEPFSGLDPVNQQVLEDAIRGLAARGATVLFSTHVMQHAERLCDRVVLIARGRKMFDGDVAAARATAPRHLDLVGAIPAEAVAGLPGVASVTPRPAPIGTELPGYHLALAPGASPAETLKAAFARGLDVREFEAKEPTLHDAFILLTGGDA